MSPQPIIRIVNPSDDDSEKDNNNNEPIKFIVDISNIYTVSFKLTEKRKKDLDQAWKKLGFRNRSAFIKALIKQAHDTNYTPTSPTNGNPLYNDGPLTVTISMRVNDREAAHIESLMKRFGLATKSDVIRLLIIEFLEGKLKLPHNNASEKTGRGYGG